VISDQRSAILELLWIALGTTDHRSPIGGAGKLLKLTTGARKRPRRRRRVIKEAERIALRLAWDRCNRKAKNVPTKGKGTSGSPVIGNLRIYPIVNFCGFKHEFH